LTNEGCDDILFFDSFDQKEHIWKIRRSIGESAKHKNIYKEEDTVIPRASLPLLLEKLSTIETLYGFRTITYGHAGDGNLHINILKDMLTDEYWENEIPKAINQIFEYCVELKGTISGEHGIGFVQKKYIPIALNSTHITLMKGIKDVFDPKGILNPSKIFPD
jgi:glycolate oxidase